MWLDSNSSSKRPLAVLVVMGALLASPSAWAAGVVKTPVDRAGPIASATASPDVSIPERSDSLSVSGSPFDWLPPHDPWIAAGLSLGVNGLGQVYNGDWDRAWWAWAPVLAYPCAWGLDALTGSNAARTTTVIWWTGAKVWSCWDAYHEAARLP